MKDIVSRLETLEILGTLYCAGDSVLNGWLKQVGMTTWNENSLHVCLSRIEIASASNLTSVSISIPRATDALMIKYVRSLPQTLRHLSLRLGRIDDDFLCDAKDDPTLINDALVPSRTYTSGVTPWIIRKSFPTLETLVIKGYYSKLFADYTFVPQLLAGLPLTITELGLPVLRDPQIDIFQLLPPNIKKLRSVGSHFNPCYPTASHSLDSLESLGLFLLNQELGYDAGLGQWKPCLYPAKLVLPRFLNRLKLRCDSVPSSIPLPLTLQTFILRGKKSYADSPFEILTLLPTSLTSFECAKIRLLGYNGSTIESHPLQTLPNLKYFSFACDFERPSVLEAQNVESLWIYMIKLMPVVETFTLQVEDSEPTLGLQGLEAFNKSTLRKLTCDLKLEEFTPIIDRAKAEIGLLLPHTTLFCSKLEKLLKSHPSAQKTTLNLASVNASYDWNLLASTDLSMLSTLVINDLDVSRVNLATLPNLTDLNIKRAGGRGLAEVSISYPPNLTRLVLPRGATPHKTFYPLPTTLRYLKCTDPAPSEVEQCTSLQTLITRHDFSAPTHQWSKSHLPTSLTYLSLRAHTWTELLEDSSLLPVAEHLHHLRTLHSPDPLSEALIDAFNGLPARIAVTVGPGGELTNPSKLASLGGFAHGEIILLPGETIKNCMNRCVARRAYKLRPIDFQRENISNDEMVRFLPYLAPSTSEIEIPHLFTTPSPLSWPSSLTKLVISDNDADAVPFTKDTRYNFPATLKTLIIQHLKPNRAPKLDLSLPKGLTRLELLSWVFDYAVQWPPGLLKLTASFTSDCLEDNLKALPSSLVHLNLKNNKLESDFFDLLPSSLKCLEGLARSSNASIASIIKRRGLIWINDMDDDSFVKYTEIDLAGSLKGLVAATLQK